MPAPPKSRYKLPSGIEQFFNKFLGLIFYYRLAFVILSIGAIIWIAVVYYINSTPDTDKLKNAALVLTCGSIIIGIFYSILNYEHNYFKTQNDKSLSKQMLSFNVAFEWHKPNIVEHLKVTKKVYDKHKHLINENKSAKFSKLLDEDDAARSSLVSIFNYLESVAVGINFDIMDEELIKKCFHALFCWYYHNYQFYIDYRRKESNNPNAWKNFTDRAEIWLTEH